MIQIRRLLCFFCLVFTQNLLAQQATWIWYPGDFEVNLSNKLQNRRTERNVFFPVFWKMDAHYVLVDFHKDFTLAEPEWVNVFVEGMYNIKVDGKAFEGQPSEILVPAGKHRINVKVYNQKDVPAIFLKGKTIVSDASWLLTYEDREWIDETGKTSDVSATQWVPAGSWNFNDPNNKPSTFSLPVKAVNAVALDRSTNQMVLDFGKESFGFLRLKGLRGKGEVKIIYGESKQEALSDEYAEAFDRIQVKESVPINKTMNLAKALRFARVQWTKGVSIKDVDLLFEYAPVVARGSFTCNDAELNKIYDVAKYTFSLNTREFFIDGIKRDRWVWSGDAYQSYLMNFYLYPDNETVKRTIFALRGKDPVTSHINTIMDYSFYWFLGIYDYYRYSGDSSFLKTIYPRMKSMMDFCLSRRNEAGFVQGLPGDWIFIDWAKGLSKKGEVSFEQLLLTRSLETMEICARIAGDPKAADQYGVLYKELKQKVLNTYWDESKGAFVHSRVDGKLEDNVTRYTNMFAIFFDYISTEKKNRIKNTVLLNDQIQKITTPYMNFYELEALCAIGEQSYVTKKIKSYWGDMLRLGATSFWEEYDPSKKGDEHYAMYGRAFGKSLCHAWGASPIYLFGKYYFGVTPTAPGFTTYKIQPSLGGLTWIKGTVPTPHGNIQLSIDEHTMNIHADEGKGILVFKSASPVTVNGAAVSAVDDQYAVTIEKGKTYTITYSYVK